MRGWGIHPYRSMRRWKAGQHLRRVILAFFVYLVFSLLYFGTNRNYGHRYLGHGLDPTEFIWFIYWWPWAISHGINPFVSHYIWFPLGVNVTWSTSVPAAALLMSPLTWLADPVVSFNVLALVSPALAAWTTFLLARYLTGDTVSSLVGGYLFGFSTYELGQTLIGHLNLDTIFLVPLLLLLILQRIRGDLSRPRFVAAFASALLVQLGLSTEVLASCSLFGAMTWLIFLVFSSQGERPRLWLVAGDILIGGAVTAILAAPFLFFIWKGLAEIPSAFQSSEYFSADLLSYIVPTHQTLLGGSSFFSAITRRFPSGSEQGAYLGLPLIPILIFQFIAIRRRPYAKPLLFSLLVPLLCSLGPYLHLSGFRTALWLPWRLGLLLPLIHRALPTRFSMFVTLAAALVAALWVSDARGRPDRGRRLAFAVLACLFLVPRPGIEPWTPLPQVPFFEPQNVLSALGPKANVLLLPSGEIGPSMIWQVASGMRFTQSGGYVGYIPPSEANWHILQDFSAGTASPSFENDLSAYCVTHQVSAILVGPGTPAPLATALNALPWQKEANLGVRIVHVPDPQVLHFYYILGNYWPQDLPESWMGSRVTVVTKGRPVQLRITGRMRPVQLGPVEVRVAHGLEVSHFLIAQPDTQILNLPANAAIDLTASATFVPDRVIHNGDERPLSVAIDLQPM